VGSLLDGGAAGAGGTSWAGAVTAARGKSSCEPRAPRIRPAVRAASRVHVGTTSQGCLMIRPQWYRAISPASPARSAEMGCEAASRFCLWASR
jgi:hypothetical protein